MNLRGRITLIVSVCSLTLAALLLAEGRSREAGMQSRLEETQVSGLRVAWAGLAGAERQRLLGHLDTFQRNPDAAASFNSGDLAGLRTATVAIRADMRKIRLQALRPDGTPFFSTTGEEPGPAVLSAAAVEQVVEGTTPVDGLLAMGDGTFAYALAAPVYDRTGVAGVVVLTTELTAMMRELSGAIGVPTLMFGQNGRLLGTGGDLTDPARDIVAAHSPTGNGLLMLRQEGSTLRLISVLLESALMRSPVGLAALQDVSEEVSRRDLISRVSYFALACATLLFLAFINWSLRTAFRPLDAVIHSLNALSEGRTDVQVGLPARNDEIGRLAGTFESFRQGMQARVRLDRIEQELDVAKRIQSQCLPRAFPEEPGLAFAADMLPMREVGGDFYDVFRLPDHRIACVIADVSDKGIGAALFMAISRTAVRSTAIATPDPAECVRRINACLCEDNETMMFVTLFYAVLEPATGRIEFCNAGHNPPAVLDPAGAIRFIRSESQPALGVWEDYAYASEQTELARGDTLLLYTDGVTEAMSVQGEEFGEDRLASTLDRLRDLPVAALVSEVIGAVRAFAGAAPQSDDITCLAVSLDAR